MINTFRLEDLLNTLIELEIKGNEQYKKMSKMSEEDDIKKLLLDLSKQELKHEKLYRKYKEEYINFQASELSNEYSMYIQAVLNEVTSVLNKSKFKTLTQAFESSLQLEKETILLLTELKHLLPEENQKNIDVLINEERKHVTYIHKLLKGERDV